MSGNRKSCERQPCEEDDPPPAATAYQDGNKAVGGSQGSSSHGAVGTRSAQGEANSVVELAPKGPSGRGARGDGRCIGGDGRSGASGV